MKGNIKTYKTITQCVSEALMDEQESDVKREQYTRFALKYFDEINFKKGTDIKTVPLTMKPWKAIELPADCIDWITIGIQCGEDIKTLVKDVYEVALLHELDGNGVKLPNEPCPDYFPLESWPTSETQVPLFNLTHLGEDPGKLFGLKVHNNGLGYFTENRNKDIAEIQLRGQIPSGTIIYLQYLSSGINPTGETLVHPYYKEWIIAGIHVERIRHGNKAEMWRLADAKEEFNRQHLLVQDYTWEWSAEDIMEILRSGYGLYPKN
jgi:hypothetical protein